MTLRASAGDGLQFGNILGRRLPGRKRHPAGIVGDDLGVHGVGLCAAHLRLGVAAKRLRIGDHDLDALGGVEGECYVKAVTSDRFDHDLRRCVAQPGDESAVAGRGILEAAGPALACAIEGADARGGLC